MQGEEEMIKDISCIVCRRRFPINIIKAKPGDVVTAYSGQTIYGKFYSIKDPMVLHHCGNLGRLGYEDDSVVFVCGDCNPVSI